SCIPLILKILGSSVKKVFELGTLRLRDRNLTIRPPRSRDPSLESSLKLHSFDPQDPRIFSEGGSRTWNSSAPWPRSYH
ncbi:hypothetical protein AVEN_188495-1, partial [Araneus ventricosus]